MTNATPDLKDTIRRKYGAIATEVSRTGKSAGCCETTCCGGGSGSADPITTDLYSPADAAALPAAAVVASLGCGNPTALAELGPGEVVLDLGSGGGIDALLAAKRVGPAGKVYGLDMTDEMLALAEANKREAGVENVKFLKGEIENIPLPDDSIDVIVSNCVINLSADKRRVLAESFRVLKPGGRFAVADIVVRGTLPADVRQDVELWIGCVAGALEENEYRELLADAGFDAIEIEPTRIHTAADIAGFLGTSTGDATGDFVSAFIRAVKPVRSYSVGAPASTQALHPPASDSTLR